MSLWRPEGGKILHVSTERWMHALPRGESQLRQAGCLLTGTGNRSILTPRTVIWDLGSHKYMLNDSIYSLCHHLFLSFSNDFDHMCLQCFHPYWYVHVMGERLTTYHFSLVWEILLRKKKVLKFRNSLDSSSLFVTFPDLHLFRSIYRRFTGSLSSLFLNISLNSSGIPFFTFLKPKCYLTM